MKRKSGRVLASLLMAFLFLFSAVPAQGAGETGRTIRVAYPYQAGLTEVDEQGNYSGYTYEYLQEIAQYTGWSYEFVEVPGTPDESLTQLMEMLENGEVDLMGGMLYSASMAELYDYSGYSYGVVETVLQVLQEDTRDLVVDSQTQQTFRVAVPSSSKQRLKELQEYCDMNLIELAPVLCADKAEQLQALREGRADALLATSMDYTSGLRTIARFAQKPFYFVLSKKCDQGIMQELNAAIADVERADPTYSTALFEKYFMPQNDTAVLTDAEQAYLAAAGTLRVGVMDGQPPFQYQKDGEFAGIAVDLLEVLAQETGLKFELVPVKGAAALEELLEAGKLDLVAGMTYDYKEANRLGLAMSRPYLSAQYVQLQKTSSTESSGGRLAASVNNNYGSASASEVLWYDSISECVAAVDRGEADFTFVDAYTGQYYVNTSAYADLKVVSQLSGQRQICFGLVKPTSRQLLSVLNKELAVLPAAHMQEIVYANTLYTPEISLRELLRDHPAVSVSLVAGILLAVIVVLLIFLRQRNASSRRLALELKKHMQVYGMVSDAFFEYDYTAQTLIVSTPRPGEDGEPELEHYFLGAAAKIEPPIRAFVEFVRQSEDGVHEKQLPREDGQLHWLRVATRTIHDDHGKRAYTVGRISDIEEERRAQQELMEKAQRDSLTGLFNTAAGRQRSEELLAGLQGEERDALILLDIDYFKEVNDRYGHRRGDWVLTRVAEVLRSSFRPEDVIGRPGGDEFVVYLRGARELAALGERCGTLCRRIRELSRDGLHLSVSIGAALAGPGDSYEAVYERADQALYRAKDAGRDRYILVPWPGDTQGVAGGEALRG